MSPTDSRLGALKQQQPEWEPWLRVVEVALRESEGPVWRDTVPAAAPPSAGAPRLAHATIALPGTGVKKYVDFLIRTAVSGGTHAMASLNGISTRDVDPVELFRAALCHDHDSIEQAAARRGVSPQAFQAVAALVPVPFLQACVAAWGGTAMDWVEAYCPVCGSWPAFAEVRGIERSRHYRCGRCGSDWHASALSCPFCATTDHRDLERLVPGDAAASAAVEACRKCRGYVKAFNRLQGCARSAVLLEDLGGVALDLAAIEQGYSRPVTPGYALDVTVAER